MTAFKDKVQEIWFRLREGDRQAWDRAHNEYYEYNKTWLHLLGYRRELDVF